jgi:hypothetical protein
LHAAPYSEEIVKEKDTKRKHHQNEEGDGENDDSPALFNLIFIIHPVDFINWTQTVVVLYPGFTAGKFVVRTQVKYA